MEIIKEIKEYCDKDKEGFVIVTDKQKIKILIDSYQSCCEQWGYITSEDDFEDYIGSELLEISLTDDALQSTILKLAADGVSSEYTDCMFINVNTSKGLLQFTLYNSHNGYYSHRATIRSTQLTADTHL